VKRSFFRDMVLYSRSSLHPAGSSVPASAASATALRRDDGGRAPVGVPSDPAPNARRSVRGLWAPEAIELPVATARTGFAALNDAL